MSIHIMDEEIRFYEKQLKIPTFANYGDVVRQADPSLGLSGLLLELMKAECEARQENQNRRRLKTVGFPFQKTLDEFDFSQLNPSVSPEYVKELASCQFVQDKRNIVMIGNPGRGKTHLSIAFGLKACAMGSRVLFKNAATLSTELREAKYLKLETQHIVKIDVRKHRRRDVSLYKTAVRFQQLPILHESCLQKSAYNFQQLFVFYIMLQYFYQPIMILPKIFYVDKTV